MKKVVLMLSAALVLWSCANDKLTQQVSDEPVQVTFQAQATVENNLTRAVADGDGAAANVNHWIMEVRDSDGDVFAYQEKTGTTGLTQTFDVSLIKGQSYNVLFWADTEGTYDASNLKAVKLANESAYLANLDSRDAFSASVSGFSTLTATTQSITLKRPLAQLNVIFTDLSKLYNQLIDSTEYAKFTPGSFQVLANVPTSFNVEDQTAGAPAATALTITAADNYLGNYAKHGTEETLFMDYFFATSGNKDVVDIDFSFVSKGNTITHTFTSVPFQRNFRTNIKGELMTANAKWNVTIDPIWNTPDYNVPFLEANSIQEVNNYISPAQSDGQEAKVVQISEQAVDAAQLSDTTHFGDTPVISFPLKVTSPNEVSFQLPAISAENQARLGTDTWLITYEPGYTTQNVAVDAPAGTKVIINAPNSHVEVTGTSYAQIVASTNTNTLVVPAGCTVDNLIVKEGGLEIHGTVTAVSIQLAQGKNIYVRECEGLSQEVYDVLAPYIAKGYKAVQDQDKWNIIVDAEFWENRAAKFFSHIDEVAKTIDIYSEAEFALLAKNVNAGTTYEGWTFTLCNALDMSGSKWTPIGRFDVAGQEFKGTFDGKNLPIKNLDVYTKDRKGNGVFGKVYAPCVLKNINIVDAVVTAEGTNTYTGGLVGHGYATIENCSFNGTVNGGNQMGGIAASGGFTIKNCTFDGTINGKYWGIGGIIGNCQDGGAISGNVAKGKIVGVLADCTDPFIGGGIIGCAIYTSYDVKDNYSDMAITFNGVAQTDYPIVGVYNIDAIEAGNKDFANLLDKLGNNTWNKSIYAEDFYSIDYNNDNPTATKYEINYGAATTKFAVATVGTARFETLADAVAAAKSGSDKVVTIVASMDYTLPGDVSGLTIQTADGVSATFNIALAGNVASADGATLKGLKFILPTSNYTGFYQSDVTFDRCIFEGLLTTYHGDSIQVFNNCCFESTGNNYSVNAYGNCRFNACSFTCNEGKAIYLYTESLTAGYAVDFTACTFENTGASCRKPAILVKTRTVNGLYTNGYKVNITSCTATGFADFTAKNDDVFNFAADGLWGVECPGNDQTDTNTIVTVDQVDVYPAQQ